MTDDQRLAEIRERLARIPRQALTVGQPTEYGHVNPAQIFAGDKSVCQMYGIPLHTVLEEVERDPRTAEGLAYAHLFAAAPSDIDFLLGELERARAERDEAREGITATHRLLDGFNVPREEAQDEGGGVQLVTSFAVWQRVQLLADAWLAERAALSGKEAK